MFPPDKKFTPGCGSVHWLQLNVTSYAVAREARLTGPLTSPGESLRARRSRGPVVDHGRGVFIRRRVFAEAKVMPWPQLSLRLVVTQRSLLSQCLAGLALAEVAVAVAVKQLSKRAIPCRIYCYFLPLQPCTQLFQLQVSSTHNHDKSKTINKCDGQLANT